MKTHIRAIQKLKNGKLVQEHRYIVEQILGKPLDKKHPIHHINEDRSDNRSCNLVVCEDAQYHKLLHTRLEAYKACGNVTWKKCKYCKQYDNPSNLIEVKSSYYSYRKECNTLYQRRYDVN